ncbi:FecR family protein [Bordetella genomosp. 12]|uniref:FecR protein domain-containing protein n=1 Tax=Bordetella genomosp. 12 TaxID=463035 RepID=A0A261VK27_9BORD|nr:FecR domain-containing protein [Bordetella genomosp. 12]OZI74081.1 hypothetical protein CAL22_06160 [Bordetella genomosp. 12]
MAARPDDGDFRAAAEWMVRMGADSEAERQAARTGFDAWLRADPRRAALAEEARALLQGLDGIRGAGGLAARRALDAAQHHGRKSRAVVRLLVLLLALCLPLALAQRFFPVQILTADVRTGTGQWLTQELPDGSRITLSAASAINIRFDAGQRVIELLQGDILVAVARDPQRPFDVRTPQGRIRALGTLFTVRNDGSATWLQMLESAVTVRPADLAQETIVRAGEQVRLTAAGVDDRQAIDAAGVVDAWKGHQLMVHDRPLPGVLDELARHRRGILHYDRDALQHIRVTAVLPLDNTDQALRLLQNNFPALRVGTLGPYLTWVSFDR